MSSRVSHEPLRRFLFYAFLPLHVFTFFLLSVRDDTRGRFPFSLFPAVHFRGFTYTSVHLSSYLPLPPSLSLYVILKTQAHPGFSFLFPSFYSFLLNKLNLCVSLSPSFPFRRHTRDMHLLGLVSLVGVQQRHVWQRPQDEAEDAEGAARPERALSSHAGFPAMHGARMQHGG